MKAEKVNPETDHTLLFAVTARNTNSATRNPTDFATGGAYKSSEAGLAVSCAVVMINRDHSMVQTYKGDKTPEAIHSWAQTIAAEWRYLMAAANLTSVDANSFASVVLNSTDMWVVMFTDGLWTKSVDFKTRCQERTLVVVHGRVPVLTRHALCSVPNRTAHPLAASLATV